MPRLLRAISFLLAVCPALYGGFSIAATETELLCGSLANAYGPYDYRKATRDQKILVEGAHFTKEVELLVSGKTSRAPGGDIDYTLRAFPNHPRALASLMELGNKNKTERPIGTKWTIECYFNRALRFQPDDRKVKMVYAMYLHRKKKFDDAIKLMEEVRSQSTDDSNVFYNLGLMYLDLGRFDQALENAHRAYALGFPLNGLKNRLKKAGHWQEPAPKERPAPATGE